MRHSLKTFWHMVSPGQTLRLRVIFQDPCAPWRNSHTLDHVHVLQGTHGLGAQLLGSVELTHRACMKLASRGLEPAQVDP